MTAILGGWALATPAARASEASAVYRKADTWQATMAATRETLLAADVKDRGTVVRELWEQFEKDFPIPSDWMLQDLAARRNDWFAADGHVVQTMRSWSTLQPGEYASCVGCHENKNETPPSYTTDSIAMRCGARPPEPRWGSPRGFSFPKEIQPILDAGAKRRWSDAYLALTNTDVHKLQGGAFIANPTHPRVNWVHAQTMPPMLPPYSAGAAKSGLIAMLAKGHEGVKLSREELDKLACWIDLAVPYCGDYLEANAWDEAEMAKYRHFQAKRERMAAIEAQNIEAWIRIGEHP